MYIIEAKTHEEWLKNRSFGIGGSEAASILGLNPYLNNVELWKIKTGRVKRKDISLKPCVILGQKSEPLLRELFKLTYPEFEMTHAEYQIIVNDKYDFIRGSLDGELINNLRQKGIFEAKTTTIRKSSDWKNWTDKIPNNYFCQILHYFGIDKQYEFAELYAKIDYIKDNLKQSALRRYSINRTDFEAEINHLIEKEIEFYWHIKNDKEPNLVLPTI